MNMKQEGFFNFGPPGPPEITVCDLKAANSPALSTKEKSNRDDAGRSPVFMAALKRSACLWTINYKFTLRRKGRHRDQRSRLQKNQTALPTQKLGRDLGWADSASFFFVQLAHFWV